MPCGQWGKTSRQTRAVSWYVAFILTGSTLESRSGCILPGWVFILSSSSLPQYWASLSSCTAYSLWMPMCQGRQIQTLQTRASFSKVCYIIITCVFILYVYISARRHVMTTWTSPCVHCVMECVTTGVWVRCAHWPEHRTCSTMEPLSSLLFSCLCGVTILFSLFDCIFIYLFNKDMHFMIGNLLLFDPRPRQDGRRKNVVT